MYSTVNDTVYRKINGVYLVSVPPAVDFYAVSSEKEQSQSITINRSVIKAQTILRKQT